MNTLLYYFFEYAVFILMFLPIANEILYLFFPRLVMETRSEIRNTKTITGVNKYVAHITGGAAFVCVAGLFTSQSFLFWIYFAFGGIVYLLSSNIKSYESNPIYTRIDGFICLVLLATVLVSRFYFNKPFLDIVMQFYVGDGPPVAPETVLRSV
jgi:hypothetical protein